MEYRQLGRSGLRVSVLAMGTLTIGGRGVFAKLGNTDVTEATRQIDRALVAAKARMPMGTGANDAGLSRYHLINECEASLRRLGTDHIDLYQVHAWDGMTPLAETLSALDDLGPAGKARYVGCSNYSGWHLMKALATSDRLGVSRFVSQQIYYSPQAREAE